jgi:hypothetical protein
MESLNIDPYSFLQTQEPFQYRLHQEAFHIAAYRMARLRLQQR